MALVRAEEKALNAKVAVQAALAEADEANKVVKARKAEVTELEKEIAANIGLPSVSTQLSDDIHHILAAAVTSAATTKEDLAKAIYTIFNAKTTAEQPAQQGTQHTKDKQNQEAFEHIHLGTPKKDKPSVSPEEADRLDKLLRSPAVPQMPNRKRIKIRAKMPSAAASAYYSDCEPMSDQGGAF